MKDDNLNNAIKNLPEYQAPDVWNNISKKLPKNNRRFLFWIIPSMIIISFLAIFLFNNSEKQYQIKEVSSELNNIEKAIKPVQFQGLVYHDESFDYDDLEDVKPDPENYYESSEYTEVSQSDEIILSEETVTEELEDESDELYKTIITFVPVGDNLVNNSGFEDFRICPRSYVDRPVRRLIPHWDVPTKGTPDYFNICSRGDAGVPDNFAGSIPARVGQAYAGIILRLNFSIDNRVTGEKPVIYREYIQTKLIEPLEKGKQYRIKFWICNSSKSRFAVDAIGACLDSERVQSNTNGLLNCVPVIENPMGSFLTNQNYWVAIEGVYKARGGEQYLTIGNFRNNSATRYVMQSNSDFNYAYYYIDDVSVVEVIESEETVVAKDDSEDGLSELPTGTF